MKTDLELIKQAQETLPEDWESITELIHQADSEEVAFTLEKLQEKKMLEYEKGVEPIKRGSYKKKGDYKARSKTKHNRNWKQENIFNKNGIHD